jgi:hypothetical protein
LARLFGQFQSVGAQAVKEAGRMKKHPPPNSIPKSLLIQFTDA